MKNIFKLFVASLLGMSAFASGATETDAAGYPVFYLRGNFDNTNWAVQDRYKFTRENSTYSLTINQLDGEFKISDDNWAINFGGDDNTGVISGSCTVNGVQDGRNYIAQSLGETEISFSYTKGQPTLISIKVKNQSVAGLSGTLPVLYINVYDESGAYDNEIIDKDLSHKNYFAGEYWLDAGEQSLGSADTPLPLEIKARGNWTRKGFAKKPFKLKLGKKQSMLGLTKSKHFAILAHADDNCGYLRNFSGFALGKRIGLPWTPWQEPIEVVINGNYRGIYFLTESIRVDADRVDITELDDLATDPDIISGGYLIELDNYDEDNQIQLDEKGCVDMHRDKLRVTFDTPEEYSDIQRRFITDQFTAMNDLVGENSDELWGYIDMDDLARYYLVEEIISHVESFHGSTYMFRDRGEGQKWHFSPLWDCGNAFNGPTDDFFYFHAPYGATWIPSIRMNDKFNEKVRETWLWFMSNQFDGFMEQMQEYAEQISAAAKADRRRWRDQPVPDGGQPVSDNSDMDSRCDKVMHHISQKIHWLAGRFGDYSDKVYPEPSRDTTEAAPLPDYAVSGVEELVGAPDSAAEYYNLQGMRVQNPQQGQFYIVRRGNTSTKLIQQ